MLQVLRHTDLSHKLVLVPIHSSQSTDMRENVLKRISELECIDVTKTVLDVSIDDKLGKTQDFTTQVESVSES